MHGDRLVSQARPLFSFLHWVGEKEKSGLACETSDWLQYIYTWYIYNYTNIQMHAYMFIRCFSDCSYTVN